MEKRPPRIIVVDDDVDACRNLADILGDIAYEVDVAHNMFERMFDSAAVSK
jgi:PleD family two-component response regulator